MNIHEFSRIHPNTLDLDQIGEDLSLAMVGAALSLAMVGDDSTADMVELLAELGKIDDSIGGVADLIADLGDLGMGDEALRRVAGIIDSITRAVEEILDDDDASIALYDLRDLAEAVLDACLVPDAEHRPHDEEE